MVTDMIGQTLLDRFRVEKYLGSGGMGTVYCVNDLTRNALLAMKVLHPDLASDPQGLAQFQLEAEALQRLAHPNIVPFYGIYQTGETAFLLEAYIEGDSLKDVIKNQNGKPLSYSQALRYFTPVCAALNYTHARGMVHCDVKPGNILCDQRGQVYVTDFGIAHSIDSSIQTVRLAGTPAYMAPEQMRREDPLPQTDIYALGVVLYEMLTGGARPYAGESSPVSKAIGEKIYWEQVNQAPVPPRSYNPGIPVSIEIIILRCLEKDPRQRYPSTLELLDELSAAIAELLESQPASRAAPKTQQKFLLQTWMGWALAAIILLGLATGIYGISRRSPPIQITQVVSPTSISRTQGTKVITPTTKTYYPIKACMTAELDTNNRVFECVTGVRILPDGKLRVEFSWEADLQPQAKVNIHPVAADATMYLTDDQGNRYNPVSIGGNAANEFTLRNNQVVRGWFVFDAPSQTAKSFIFYDEDNGIQTPEIQRIWP